MDHFCLNEIIICFKKGWHLHYRVLPLEIRMGLFMNVCKIGGSVEQLQGDSDCHTVTAQQLKSSGILLPVANQDSFEGNSIVLDYMPREETAYERKCGPT